LFIKFSPDIFKSRDGFFWSRDCSLLFN